MRIAVSIVSPFMELKKRFDTEKQAEKWLEQQKKIHDLSVERAIANQLSSENRYGKLGVSQSQINHVKQYNTLSIPGMIVKIIDTQYTLELN